MIAGIATAGASSAMIVGSRLAIHCILEYMKLGASVTGQEEAVSRQIGASADAPAPAPAPSPPTAGASADLVFFDAPATAPAPAKATAPAPAPAPAQL